MPASLSALLERPPDLDATIADAWFARIATRLLGACRLRVAGSMHRLVEVEFYFHGAGHLDPFAHCHPSQTSRGRWYFHRIGPSYRGGSFKGVDLTFGDGTAHGGILLRSLETAEGTLVVGPSLCVDHLLATSGCSSVAALDGAIGERPAADPEALVHLMDGDDESVPVPEAAGLTMPGVTGLTMPGVTGLTMPGVTGLTMPGVTGLTMPGVTGLTMPGVTGLTMFRSARVGLSLKRHNDAVAVDLLARRYRFLTEPRRVTKGRTELIVALLADGRSPEEIHRLTGSPLKTITGLAR